MDRRSFVRTAAAGAGAAAVLSAPFLLPRFEPNAVLQQSFTYYGARHLDGPAPKGVPLIPIRVNADGIVEAVPQATSTVAKHSLAWYRFCGHEGAPGLREDYGGDNILRYDNRIERLRQAEKDFGAPLWYADRIDEAVRASDFKAAGQGAPFRWRSEGQDDRNKLMGILIKVDPTKLRAGFPDGFMEQDLAAYSSACTHMCCTAGYRESRMAEIADWHDKIYCTCHNSVFDPLDVRPYRWPPNKELAGD